MFLQRWQLYVRNCDISRLKCNIMNCFNEERGKQNEGMKKIKKGIKRKKD
jgi:hypothetical protein